MAENRWIIVSGGRFDEAVLREEMQKPFCGLIACDSGLTGLLKAGILPSVMIGDFDSVPESVLAFFRKQQVPEIRLNPVKDATDTEEAVFLAEKKGAGEVVLLGATGTRLDHVHANVELLYALEERGIDASLRDAYNTVRVINHAVTLKKDEMRGDYFSLYPFFREACVSVSGAGYPLKKAVLSRGNSLGTSNYVSENVCHIEIHKGPLLLIESRD